MPTPCTEIGKHNISLNNLNKYENHLRFWHSIKILLFNRKLSHFELFSFPNDIVGFHYTVSRCSDMLSRGRTTEFNEIVPSVHGYLYIVIVQVPVCNIKYIDVRAPQLKDCLLKD